MSLVEELTMIGEGQKYDAFLPYLSLEIGKMEKGLETRMYQHLEKGTLTPEMAFQGWLEKQSYRNILKRFQQRVQLGVAAGERNKPLLDGEWGVPISSLR